MNGRFWKCKCKNHHSASLRLETRPSTPDNSKPSFKFRMLLSKDQTDDDLKRYSKWREVDVESVELVADLPRVPITREDFGARIVSSPNQPR